MKFNCIRCGSHGEYHLGPKTGGSTAEYLGLRNEINQSGIISLSLHRSNELCIPCMKELLLWIENREAQVHRGGKHGLKSQMSLQIAHLSRRLRTYTDQQSVGGVARSG